MELPTAAASSSFAFTTPLRFRRVVIRQSASAAPSLATQAGEGTNRVQNLATSTKHIPRVTVVRPPRERRCADPESECLLSMRWDSVAVWNNDTASMLTYSEI